MFANFSIITGEGATAPAIPQKAVIYEGEEARVWVAGDNENLALRQIRTGRISGGLVEVLAGCQQARRSSRAALSLSIAPPGQTEPSELASKT
jgi:cobalt-zinc-cadmium efflux system membrane fusion protein